MKSFLFAALVASASAAALPQQQEIEARQANAKAAFCKVVTKVIVPATQQASATAYCSSYLSLGPRPTTTVISTAYAPEVTEFITSKVSVVCQAPVTTSTVTPAAPPPKRDPTPGRQSSPKPKPQCFGSYKKADVISSACKCLNIPTGTVTSTSTTTVTNTHKAMVTETTVMTPPRFKLLAVKADGSNDIIGFMGGETPLTIKNVNGAVTYALDLQGQLRNNTYTGAVANQDRAGGPKHEADGKTSYVYLNREADITAQGYDAIKCKAVAQPDQTCRLVCNGDEVNSYVPPDPSYEKKKWELTDKASAPADGVQFYQVIVPWDGA